MPARPLSPRAKLLLPVLLLVLVLLSIHRLRSTPHDVEVGPTTVAFSGRSMGTTYSVKLVPPADLQPQQAHSAVRSALDAVDAAMSTYRKDSELSRFNDSPSLEPQPLSPALHTVFEVALSVGRASGGALDVTVAPLVDAWGFGPGDGEQPDAGALEALRERVGLDKLALDDRGLRKARPDVRCDLSAVAKGYAVDRAAQALADLGVTSYLVEVGGELFARGRRADGAPWRVAIEKPLEGTRAIQRVLPLVDAGLATSGDYRNYYERDGKRISHLIDPRTGSPIEHGLASVSVVHGRVAVADAWATALSVLGPEAGPRVAEREGLAAFFLVRQPDGTFRTMESPAFTAAFPH